MALVELGFPHVPIVSDLPVRLRRLLCEPVARRRRFLLYATVREIDRLHPPTRAVASVTGRQTSGMMNGPYVIPAMICATGAGVAALAAAV